MMTDMIIVNRKVLAKRSRSHLLYSFGAAVGVVMGTISMLAALILICISAVTGEGFDGVEVILIFASFILCLTGAHCLDLYDKSRKIRRKQELYFRHNNGNKQ